MPLFHLQCVRWLVYPHVGHCSLAILFQVAGMNAPSECPLCSLSWINISLGSWEEIKLSLSSIIQKKYKMIQLMEAPILRSCQAQEHTKPKNTQTTNKLNWVWPMLAYINATINAFPSLRISVSCFHVFKLHLLSESWLVDPRLVEYLSMIHFGVSLYRQEFAFWFSIAGALVCFLMPGL